MIKQGELRIGNWVKHNDIVSCSEYPGTIFQWTDAHWYDLVRARLHLASIEQIPLTPEILWKIGWIKTEVVGPYEYWFPNAEALWSIRQEGNGNWQLCILTRPDEVFKFEPNISALHQLQNLYFALTGNELTINL